MDTSIDLFAGLGGLTEGAQQAGVRCIWAGNHWPEACDIFEANHGLKPKCQDMHQALWHEVPKHDLFLAAPACQGHSLAHGHDLPRHDTARSTAWAVVSCLEVHRTGFGILENVPRFLRWVMFPAFKEALRAIGISFAPHLVDAADFGVPQNRPRLAGILTKSKNPLFLDLPKKDHVPASTVIDWTAPGWSKISTKCQKTRDRIRAGRKVHGDRFLFPYYSSGSGLTGRSLGRPIGTITTIDRWGVVDGEMMRMVNLEETRRFMGFRDDFILPKNVRLAKHMLGNAVPPMMGREIITALKQAA
jgi:DNA (cytosine-5)-methyltransferase 1